MTRATLAALLLLATQQRRQAMYPILSIIVTVLLLAAPAQAIKIAFCEYDKTPSTGCSLVDPLHLGDVWEHSAVAYHTWIYVDEGETWTDNVCAVRIVGRSSNAGGYREQVETTMSYGTVGSEIDTVWAYQWNAAEYTPYNLLLFSRFTLWSIAEGHAGEWVEMLPGLKSMALQPWTYDPICDSPHELTYAIDHSQSGAAHSMTGDPPVWDCGGLTGGSNPIPPRVPADAENIVLDIQPLDYVTSLSFDYYPDKDNDDVTNVSDNCLYTPNNEQVDTDSDGYGNMCDPDWNNDGYVDSTDFILLSARYGCVVGDSCYDPVYDMEYGLVYPLTGTGLIGASEFILMSQMWGEQMDAGGVVCGE